MIVYFDTSAFVPLLVAEAGSKDSRRLWDSADDVATTRLLHVEASAALARAQRLARLTAEQTATAAAQLEELWSQMQVIEFDQALELVAASGDQDLLSAWTELGLATFDSHQDA